MFLGSDQVRRIKPVGSLLPPSLCEGSEGGTGGCVAGSGNFRFDGPRAAAGPERAQENVNTERPRTRLGTAAGNPGHPIFPVRMLPALLKRWDDGRLETETSGRVTDGKRMRDARICETRNKRPRYRELSHG